MEFRLRQLRVAPSLSMQAAKVFLSDGCSCSACWHRANAPGARLQDTWASWPASDFILMGRAHATKPEDRGFESVERYRLPHTNQIYDFSSNPTHEAACDDEDESSLALQLRSLLSG
jgi:hypothetical protein